MRNSIKFLGSLAVAGLVAAGGSAFTASNTMAKSDQVVGYGSTTISGATVNSMTYSLNPAGDNVNSVTLVLAGDTHLSAVWIGFDGLQTSSCGTGTVTQAVVSPAAAAFTTYTCDNGGSSFEQSTAGLTSTAVVVN